MPYRGSCHCGRIAFVVEGEIAEAIDCNCSLCRRRGGLLAFVPREALRLTAGEGDDAVYRFHQHRIDHHFCPTCGVAPFSEAVDPRSGARMAAVNVRCLPELDLRAITITAFDGAAL